MLKRSSTDKLAQLFFSYMVFNVFSQAHISMEQNQNTQSRQLLDSPVLQRSTDHAQLARHESNRGRNCSNNRRQDVAAKRYDLKNSRRTRT